MTTALPDQIPMQQAANPVSQDTDPLAGLHDIHMPEAIGWWPPAPGWWLLLGLVFISIAALFFYRRWNASRNNRPVVYSTKAVMQEALLEFTAIEQHYHEHEASTDHAQSQTVADISQLLRRCSVQLARINNEPEAVAGITGNDWLNWLDGRWEREDFMQGAGRILIDAPYRNSFSQSDAVPELFTLCRAWLEQQR